MNSPYSVAQETLGMSSAARGIGGMNSKVRPGPNQSDAGAASKPGINSQPFNNARLEEQEMKQNILSASPQAGADAMGRVRAETVNAASANDKAQQFAAQRMSEVLYANESGSALMALNSKMQSPERGKFLNDIAVGKAISQGMNPDLGQEVAQASMYG